MWFDSSAEPGESGSTETGARSSVGLLPLTKSDAQPVVLSINVGMPKNVEWQGKTVFTGIWKYPVDGPRMVRKGNIEGDGQGDPVGHGGEMRAVFVYQLASYWHWQEYFGRSDLEYGNFGENFTIDGLADDEVCIGDRYRIGEAEFEVTQPRVTCYRVGMRLDEPQLPALLVSHHRPGFYMRVITEGHVQAGDAILKTKSGEGGISVADIDALLYLPDRDTDKLQVAVEIPALSPGWQQSFHDLLDNPETALAGPSESAWSGFRKLLVSNVTRETSSVTSITFKAPDGRPLPTYRPGQYLTLRLPDAGTPAPVRNYSLSGDAGNGIYRISVKHETHGVASSYLNTSVIAGDQFDVAAPRGEFVLAAGSGPILFVSAGIGVTPVLAMLHQLVGERSERDVWWLHAARRPEEHALASEARGLLELLPAAHERIYYSAIDAREVRDEVVIAGRLTGDALAMLDISYATSSAYVCGPSAFMDDMRASLLAAGMLPSGIHTEQFGATDSSNPGVVDAVSRPPHQPEGRPGAGPLVTFARSNLAVPFGGTGRTILELAEACDVQTRWSCRSGVCHVCVTPILSGEISYSPDPLEPPATEEVLICRAQPRADVVLDM